MFLSALLKPRKKIKKLSSTKELENLLKGGPVEVPAELVRRNEWGAREAKELQPLKTPVASVVLKYGTNTERCDSKEDCIQTVKEIQRRHMDEKGMPDIGYNFLIGSDGRIYEGRGWHSKTEPYPLKDERYRDLNSKSIDIVFIGRWIEKPPLADMMSAVADLCMEGEKKGFLDSEWEVFGPSRLRKPIIRHQMGVKVESKKNETWNLDNFFEKHLIKKV